jgi:hypothetical protein
MSPGVVRVMIAIVAPVILVIITDRILANVEGEVLKDVLSGMFILLVLFSLFASLVFLADALKYKHAIQAVVSGIVLFEMVGILAGLSLSVGGE